MKGSLSLAFICLSAASFCLFSFFFYLMGEIKIGSLNINGCRDALKRAAVFELIKQKNINVMFLQETHSDDRNCTEWMKEWKGDIVLSHGSSLSAGVAVLFSENVKPISVNVEEVIKGRLLVVRAVMEKTSLVFINIYAPTDRKERVLFLKVLEDTLLKCEAEEYLFLGGDFNCTENDKEDRNHVEPHTLSAREMRRITGKCELKDLWKTLNINKRQYTWVKARGDKLSLARLDRFYCFKHHFSTVKSCFITPTGLSDHCVLIVTVLIPAVRTRSAYWHFNTLLTNDAHFKTCFIFFWQQWRRQKASFSSLTQWWDVGKVQIRQLCQQYTVSVTRGINESMRSLEKDILELQQALESTSNSRLVEDLKGKKALLIDLLDTKAQGALTRSRFQSLSQVDAPTKYFFSLEKKQGQSKLIHCLRAEDGRELQETGEIRRRAVQFYTELFSSQVGGEDTANTHNFHQGLPQVPEEERKGLESTLSLQELSTALSGLSNGKAPGIDGLPTEFYKTFWSELGEDLLAVYNESLAKGELPLSCRRTVVTLLPKKGNLCEIKNWRPVSLLCVDYKLLSKTLASRLRDVLGSVIHSDQTYCVPGRSIFDNIFLIRDILEVSKIFGLNTGLISLDQEKAFDRVEHQYLWRTMQAFGFGPVFIAMTQVLYRDIHSVLKINGGLSAPFRVQRGVRQGCALSGMLYSLAIEPLLQELRRGIGGLSILHCPGPPVTVSAYADDLVVMVKGEQDIKTLHSTLVDFETLSSAKVNWNKSCALLLGQWEVCGPPALPGGLQWSRGGFKYLGVHLGNDISQIKNWEGVLEGVKARLGRWRWLLPQLCYRGRALIINNLVASTLWHRLVCLEPPQGLLEEVQKVMLDFFWDGLHWLRKGVLYLPREKGGQGVMDVSSRVSAFRLQSVQRLLYGPDSLSWRLLACALLRRAGALQLDKHLFLVDSSRVDLSSLPTFYRSMLRAWRLLRVERGEEAPTLHWLLEEPIVNNPLLAPPSTDAPALNHQLIRARHLLDLRQGCWLSAERLSAELGVHSVQRVERFLSQLRSALSPEGRLLLKELFQGHPLPDIPPPFPGLRVSPAFREEAGPPGPLLEAEGLSGRLVSSMEGKALYRVCVLVKHQTQLTTLPDTPWRARLEEEESTVPAWSSLYKPPPQ